jgi:hypothetical protein
MGGDDSAVYALKIYRFPTKPPSKDFYASVINKEIEAICKLKQAHVLCGWSICIQSSRRSSSYFLLELMRIFRVIWSDGIQVIRAQTVDFVVVAVPPPKSL